MSRVSRMMLGTLALSSSVLTSACYKKPEASDFTQSDVAAFNDVFAKAQKRDHQDAQDTSLPADVPERIICWQNGVARLDDKATGAILVRDYFVYYSRSLNSGVLDKGPCTIIYNPSGKWKVISPGSPVTK